MDTDGNSRAEQEAREQEKRQMMIERAERDRRKGVVFRLQELLCELDYQIRSQGIPANEPYWRSQKMILIDDADAVAELHQRIKEGRDLREWESLLIYSPHARQIGYVLRRLQPLMKALQTPEQWEAARRRIFRTLMQSQDQNVRVVINSLLCEARRSLICEVGV
jgi:hypothetical protein